MMMTDDIHCGCVDKLIPRVPPEIRTKFPAIRTKEEATEWRARFKKLFEEYVRAEAKVRQIQHEATKLKKEYVVFIILFSWFLFRHEILG